MGVNTRLQIKRADEIVSETLARNPDWVLFRWLRWVVLRFFLCSLFGM